MPSTSLATSSSPRACAPSSVSPAVELCAFASRDPLGRAEMLNAPVRWPRPSRLEVELESPSGKAAEGMAARVALRKARTNSWRRWP